MTVTYTVTVQFRIDAHPEAPEWLRGIILDETTAHWSVDEVSVKKEKS